MSEKKTPEFICKYEKIKDHWPAFVAHKTSEKSKKMSETNKQNAAKKQFHHRTGSGGYLKAQPKWSKAENDLLEKGIEPETMYWPDRCRTWFFGAGGTLDPVSGKCHWTDEQLKNTSQEASALYQCSTARDVRSRQGEGRAHNGPQES